ncbi:endonuclease/exonuclease/phosphatase family protein [candidate division KSB1 bacterium]
MNVYRYFCVPIILFLSCTNLISQVDDSSFYKSFNAEPRYESGVRIVFYNVENLFDIHDDSLVRDDDFTTEGRNKWDYYKYINKLTLIYKTLVAIGGWEMPGIIGFCEVENRYVLDQLIDHTPLSQYNYEIVHQESPDERGIDVALLYRPAKFEVVHYQAIHVNFPFDTEDKTRDILYVKGLLLDKDTLHLYVNHWPSRSGGVEKSNPKRAEAAKLLKQHSDSILQIIPSSKIVIMGDLNDEPGDESIINYLNARSDTTAINSSELIDLMTFLPKGEGTHKYRGNWHYLDHFIITGSLINNSTKLQLSKNGVQVFKAPFLLEDDQTNLGKKPFRTFAGPNYLGGFSDHLPIFIDLLYY